VIEQIKQEFLSEGRPKLTTREAEIARLAAEGYSNKGIGERLYITQNTVKTQLKKDKLEERNAAGSISRAFLSCWGSICVRSQIKVSDSDDRQRNSFGYIGALTGSENSKSSPST
jgi:DNA-binding CsgD family transcriptional regulator